MERNVTFGRDIEETRKQIKAPDKPKTGVIRRVDSPASIHIRLCRFNENLGACPKISRSPPRKRPERSGTPLFVEQSRRKSKHVRGLSAPVTVTAREGISTPPSESPSKQTCHDQRASSCAGRVLTHIWRTSNAKKAKRLTDWSGRARLFIMTPR